MKHGGLYEVGFGITLGELVHEIGGGTASGRPVRAVQVGGPLGAYHRPSDFHLPFDYEAFAEAGGPISHAWINVEAIRTVVKGWVADPCVDLIISTGGTGFSPRCNERRGNEKGPLVLSLHGNPTSALVTGRLFLAPLLAGLTGRAADAALRWRQVSLASSLKACGERETFTRAKWQGNRVVVLSDQDSGAQRALAEAELLIRQRAGDPALKEGDLVEVLEFG